MVTQERSIKNLREGLKSFFHEKLAQYLEKKRTLLNEHGYHLEHKDVQYLMNFIKEEPVPYVSNNIKFILTAKLPHKKADLEERIKASRISNTKLNKESVYLRNQEIEVNSTNINISCILKKNPETEEDVKEVCKNVWSYIIRPLMKEIYF